MADEQQPGSVDSEAGDAGNSPVDSGAGDTVSRSDLDAAIKRRDKALSEARAERAKVEDLQKQIDELKGSHDLKVKELSGELADARGVVRKRDFTDVALAGVPTKQKREEADLLLTGLMAKDQIDPLASDNWEDLAKDVAGKLQGIAPHLFSAETQQPASPGGQQVPPSSEDWGKYKSKEDIPRHLWGKVPPNVWNSLPGRASERINI